MPALLLTGALILSTFASRRHLAIPAATASGLWAGNNAPWGRKVYDMAKYKYTSYAALAAAFKSGELDPEKYVLMLDNDNCYLSYRGDDMDEDDAFDHCEKLFWGNGDFDFEEVVTALGIPCEGV